MKFIKAIPMATCSLALALAALGNLFGAAGLPNLRIACGILSASVLLVFLLKIIFHFPHANAELKTPVPMSVLPTSTMAVMLLGTYILDYINPDIARVVWYAGLTAHILLMLLFAKRFIIGFKLATVFPSWFIPFVGLVVISVTAPAFDAIPIGQAAFWAGFALYFIGLFLIILRMAKIKIFPEPARPTIAIFTAPMSLLIVGYFNSFAPPYRNNALIYIMLTVAVANYLFVSIMMFKLLKIKFYPTYAAFTFPYVISATAFRLGHNFLYGQGHSLLITSLLIHISFWLAIAAVVYVLAHYVKYFLFWLRF